MINKHKKEAKTYSTLGSVRELQIEVSFCPLCQIPITPTWDCKSHSYSKCPRCHLFIQSPQPTAEALIERYGDHYFSYEKENEEAFFNLSCLGLADIQFEKSIEPYVPKKNILDIGCATGRLLHMFKEEKGWNVQGVEVSQGSAEYGNTEYGVNIFNGTLEEANLSPNSFGVIHASHLIEHLTTPLDFIERVATLLAPGGFFLCTTPNTDSYQARRFKASWRSAISDHVYLFSKENLPLLAATQNLKLIDIKTWGGLGAGYSSQWRKKKLDKAVKKKGTGDVMLGVFQKKKIIDTIK